MNTEDPLTSAVLGYSASQRCDVANPGGQPCSRRKGHAGAHDQQSYGLPEPSVEGCCRELRAMFPEVQICVGIRDCGEETQTLRGTTLEYDAQIGMNGNEFAADSLSELMAQVRAYKEQEKS